MLNYVQQCYLTYAYIYALWCLFNFTMHPTCNMRMEIYFNIYDRVLSITENRKIRYYLLMIFVHFFIYGFILLNVCAFLSFLIKIRY